MTGGASRSGALLGALAAVAVAALLAALLLPDALPVAQRHVMFAMAVLPLILGAMLYFVPVLTRSAPARPLLMLLPSAAFVGGGLVVLAMTHRPGWLPSLAAALSLIVAMELGWVLRRRAAVLGSAHSGVDWYVYALVAAFAALLAVAASALHPQSWAALRNLHLHLNLLGFLGLTAIGTLRVLLPTAMALPDPSAAAFLRRQLPWAAGGAAGIAFGAAFWKPLAIAGACAWLVAATNLIPALRAPRARWLQWHGAAAALAAAAIGWVLLLGAGLFHAVGTLASDAMFALLVFGFLLPLITGATSYLIPVWRWPGGAAALHGRMRERLVRFSGVRVAAFWTSAVAGTFGSEWAFVPAACALAVYLLQLALAFARVRGFS